LISQLTVGLVSSVILITGGCSSKPDSAAVGPRHSIPSGFTEPVESVKLQWLATMAEFRGRVLDYRFRNLDDRIGRLAMLTVLKTDNQQFRILAFSPTADELAFMQSLRVGSTYRFPNVYADWLKGIR